MNTPILIRNEFKALVKAYKELEKDNVVPVPDKYWADAEKFKERLRKFLQWDFSTLTAKQLLQLCALVSRFRPVEPFRFLIACSQLNKNEF